jgi:hypothetical protein
MASYPWVFRFHVVLRLLSVGRLKILNHRRLSDFENWNSSHVSWIQLFRVLTEVSSERMNSVLCCFDGWQNF